MSILKEKLIRIFFPQFSEIDFMIIMNIFVFLIIEKHKTLFTFFTDYIERSQEVINEGFLQGASIILFHISWIFLIAISLFCFLFYKKEKINKALNFLYKRLIAGLLIFTTLILILIIIFFGENVAGLISGPLVIILFIMAIIHIIQTIVYKKMLNYHEVLIIGFIFYFFISVFSIIVFVKLLASEKLAVNSINLIFPALGFARAVVFIFSFFFSDDIKREELISSGFEPRKTEKYELFLILLLCILFYFIILIKESWYIRLFLSYAYTLTIIAAFKEIKEKNLHNFNSQFIKNES